MRNRKPDKYKDFQKHEAYERNPFNDLITGIGSIRLKPKEELLVPVYREDGTQVKANYDGFEYKAGTVYTGKEIYIDRRQYAKVYIEFISMLVKDGLSFPAVKLLFFVLKRLKPEQDTVKFTISAAKANTGYKTAKSIYEGLCELIELGVIAKKEDTEEEYFINPQFIFRGRREKMLNGRGDE